MSARVRELVGGVGEGGTREGGKEGRRDGGKRDLPVSLLCSCCSILDAQSNIVRTHVAGRAAVVRTSRVAVGP
jgi:hypothetical protein